MRAQPDRIWLVGAAQAPLVGRQGHIPAPTMYVAGGASLVRAARPCVGLVGVLNQHSWLGAPTTDPQLAQYLVVCINTQKQRA